LSSWIGEPNSHISHISQVFFLWFIKTGLECNSSHTFCQEFESLFSRHNFSTWNGNAEYLMVPLYWSFCWGQWVPVILIGCTQEQQVELTIITRCCVLWRLRTQVIDYIDQGSSWCAWLVSSVETSLLPTRP